MTPTLFQLSPPLSRLALLRCVPFWAQALALCALFAVTGVAVVDDYGVGADESFLRKVAAANANYIAAGDIGELSQKPDLAYRYYGVAFEMPLLLTKRALGLQDTYYIYLMRHLATHLLFIAGGFACGMLVYRMLGSKWVALLAMLMFLLHPRLYAHSFFNSKDIPFAALMVIALYLAHYAFRKNTIGAFLLCGIGVGLAINLRVFGFMLPPIILAMRALDMWQAGRAERMRILASVGVFVAAALAVVYIVHPYYWENPLRFIEGVRVLSQHPSTITLNLFMGEIYPSDAVPWNYIPVWFAITAPPVALLLGAIGCAAVCWQGMSRPLAALRDRETRFRIMLLCCFALPVVAVITLQSNIYNGWRHMYFLWAPFCLLAAVGLHSIANIRMRGGGDIWKVGARLPGWVRGGGLRRTLAYGAAGVGLITTLTAMAALHPHHEGYFNALVDTETPDALAKQYRIREHSRTGQLQLMEHLLARYPDDVLRVSVRKEYLLILPQTDRERIVNAPAADFYIYSNSETMPIRLPERLALHSIEVYGNVIAYIIAPNTDAHRDYYGAEYNDVAANGTLLARSDFDIYIHDGALHYIKENCETLPASVESRGIPIFLHIFPVDSADLPAYRRGFGFDDRTLFLDDRFGLFDGKCITQRPLPDYPIVRIATGMYMKGDLVWRADINLAARAAVSAVYDGIVAGDYGKPVAQSRFDLYLVGNALVYLKAPCAKADSDARFFLHIFPADPADLPADSRERGFANLDFQFADHGADIGGKCVATRDLPPYSIDRIRTGQFVSGEGRVWGAEFPVVR